jgi:hypothetical protein
VSSEAGRQQGVWAERVRNGVEPDLVVRTFDGSSNTT